MTNREESRSGEDEEEEERVLQDDEESSLGPTLVCHPQAFASGVDSSDCMSVTVSVCVLAAWVARDAPLASVSRR